MTTIDILNEVFGGLKEKFHQRFKAALKSNGIEVIASSINDQTTYEVDFQSDVVTCEYRGVRFNLHGSHKGAQWKAEVKKRGRILFDKNVQSFQQLTKALDKAIREGIV